MRVATNATRRHLAQFPPAEADVQDDFTLGHAQLSTVRAQRALRAAGVECAWIVGRAPLSLPGRVPARVVGVMFAGRPSPGEVLENLAGLEHVLKGVCDGPVSVQVYFRLAAVPTSAVPVAVRAAERPALPVPANLVSRTSANDGRQDSKAPAVVREPDAACLVH